MRNWQSRNSDRFFLTKLYLASAADTAEGSYVSIQSFLNQCRKHKNPEHEYEVYGNDLVAIHILGAAVDKSFPNGESRGDKWYATLSSDM